MGKKLSYILAIGWVLFQGLDGQTQSQVIRNWGLDSAFNADVDARKAWEITRGSRQVVVAVIDTGIDPEHPDLKSVLWKKGKTDEYGWDFVENRKNPTDAHGHGTHIAGIIAGAAGPEGAIGIAPNVSIMVIRYHGETLSGTDTISNLVKGIYYAVDNGAKIINFSGGGTDFSTAEKKAVAYAEKRGVLLVAAAGNNHRDLDKSSNSFYPASHALSNVIGVAATDINNNLVTSSNWGAKTVPVAAPGENIFSTLPGKRYGYLTGTSQATAFVTGIAALVWSQHPSLSYSEVKAAIVESADEQKSLDGKVTSHGRVNAYRALKRAEELDSSDGWNHD